MKFVDTNVLIYFIDSRNTAKQSIARAVLANAIGSRQYVISAQVLNEFANVALNGAVSCSLRGTLASHGAIGYNFAVPSQRGRRSLTYRRAPSRRAGRHIGRVTRLA